MRDDHSPKDFQYITMNNIEVRVDFVRPSTPVEYRFLDDNPNDDWRTTPFQSHQAADMFNAALIVNDWLDGQY